ncbi:MAG: putative HTH-type transcriptional regulator [Nocardioidaceae bacterium]|nr:putative HTH-type transcriptional regulator [Nocardioidaceae bacterium]
MDSLGDLLDGPRARGAFLLRAVMEPPWSMRVADQAPLTLVAMTAGEAWYLPDDSDPVRLVAGDVALIRGPAPYTVADEPATPVQVRIEPDQVCVDVDGVLVDQSMALGVRTWGNAVDGRTTMLIGTWHVESEVSRPLLEALPTFVVRRRGEWDDALVALLVSETGRDEPGQASVLDRLLDLVLVSVLRSWLPEGAASVGVAHADPVVGRALRLIHERPEQPWSLEGLARACGSSRAVFARRFTELVGEPVIGYLTRWRLAVAADLLAGTDAGLEQVAREVGYGSPYALSTAFKRHHGVSPRDYRRGSGRSVLPSHAPAVVRATAQLPS